MPNKLLEGCPWQKCHACMVLLASDRPPSKYFRHTLPQGICADAEEHLYTGRPPSKCFRHTFLKYQFRAYISAGEALVFAGRLKDHGGYEGRAQGGADGQAEYVGGRETAEGKSAERQERGQKGQDDAEQRQPAALGAAPGHVEDVVQPEAENQRQCGGGKETRGDAGGGRRGKRRQDHGERHGVDPQAVAPVRQKDQD